jgi:hypothetical protein
MKADTEPTEQSRTAIIIHKGSYRKGCIRVFLDFTSSRLPTREDCWV